MGIFGIIALIAFIVLLITDHIGESDVGIVWNTEILLVGILVCNLDFGSPIVETVSVNNYTTKPGDTVVINQYKFTVNKDSLSQISVIEKITAPYFGASINSQEVVKNIVINDATIKAHPSTVTITNPEYFIKWKWINISLGIIICLILVFQLIVKTTYYNYIINKRDNIFSIRPIEFKDCHMSHYFCISNSDVKDKIYNQNIFDTKLFLTKSQSYIEQQLSNLGV